MLRPGEAIRDAFQGNCVSMARAFAKVLRMADVVAEAKEIRPEEDERAFVVYAPNFVDRMVTGHIHKEGAWWPRRYLFTNHTATWVPSLNTYYDPMAGTTYQNLNQCIEMELQQIDASTYEGQFLGRTWHLVRNTNVIGPGGGFFRFDMAPVSPVPQGYIASPLGVFQEGP